MEHQNYQWISCLQVLSLANLILYLIYCNTRSETPKYFCQQFDCVCGYWFYRHDYINFVIKNTKEKNFKTGSTYLNAINKYYDPNRLMNWRVFPLYMSETLYISTYGIHYTLFFLNYLFA